MNLRHPKASILAALVLLFAVGTAQAQTGTKEPPSPEQVEAMVSEVLSSAGQSFRVGLVNLKEDRRREAKKAFDASVDTFLNSPLSISRSSRLSDCFNKLNETIFRLEVSSLQLPMLSDLTGSCGWRIEPELMSAVVSPRPNASGSERSGVVQGPPVQTGFAEQKHETSPLDELAKLELTEEERDVESPEAQLRIEKAKRAVDNNSLGFRFQIHPLVTQFINYYQGRGRTTMTTGLYRSGMFMRMARRIFREEGIPENVAWLGQVESAWKPLALSWASASGLWQFIPSTGERFGLRRTAFVDERNSFEKATRASARYLRFLANRYGGNWELALAAYNSGEGNVDRAIARAGVANFWIAYPYLPRETRNYVPNILATILIANNPGEYGFGHIRPAAPLAWDPVEVPGSTNLSFIAQAAGTTVEYLRYLNPELRPNMTPPETYSVRVPSGRRAEVVAMFRRGAPRRIDGNPTSVSADVARTTYQRPAAASAAPLTSGTRTVKVKKGDTLIRIAKQHGVKPSEIANLNGLPSVDATLRLGRELKIPVK